MTTEYDDDPKLTAYALGELPESEVPETEAFLAEHPEARETVRRIREFGQKLAYELHTDDQPGLTAKQKIKLIGKEPPERSRWVFVRHPILAATAVLAVIFLFAALLTMLVRELTLVQALRYSVHNIF